MSSTAVSNKGPEAVLAGVHQRADLLVVFVGEHRRIGQDPRGRQ